MPWLHLCRSNLLVMDKTLKADIQLQKDLMMLCDETNLNKFSSLSVSLRDWNLIFIM